jgi:hypothetical protein
MELNNWLYLLHDRLTNEYLYLDSNNSVARTTDLVGLTYTPDGWQKKSLAWERDTTKWGLVRAFTVNLNFVLDGKALIERIALQQSFEAPIELLIQKLFYNTATDAFQYIDFYAGELNLSALESDELHVSVPIVQGGVEKQLKANEGTLYEFEPDEVSIYNDGITLQMTQNWLITEGLQFADNGVHMIGCVKTTTDGQAAGFASFDVFFDREEVSDFVNDDRYIFTTTQAITGIQLTGQINIHAGSSDIYTVTLKSSTGKTYELVNQSCTNNTNYSFDISQTIDSDVNEKWFLFGRHGTAFGIMYYTEGELHVSLESRYAASHIAGLTAWELYKRLVEKITGDRTNAESSLLQGLQNIIISCGDAVRGITGAKIKTSMADFFKFCRVVMNAGLGIEDDKIVIEELSHFFDTSSPIDLGECRNLKWKFADDLIFNTLKIGWDNKTADGANGKSIFNATHNYSTDIKSVSKGLELVTNYVADPFYQEILRINLDGKTTTDNDADNEIMVFNTVSLPLAAYTANFGAFFANYFILLQGAAGDIANFSAGTTITVNDPTGSNTGDFLIVSVFVQNTTDLALITSTPAVTELNKAITIGTPVVTLLRETYVNTDTGVPDISSLYNIEYLSTKRIANRWRSYFNSVLFQFAGSEIYFESTEKNRELKTETAGGVIVDEDSDIIIGGSRLFKGIYLTFETQVEDVVPSTLNSTPNVGFLTTWNGIERKGVLMKGAMACNELTAQSFKLLLDKDQDETNLL